MKTIIAGGRDYFLDRDDYNKLIEIHKTMRITEVVSGCAAGTDSCGIMFANMNNIPVTKFKPIWKENGKFNPNAGHIRNEKMAKYADTVVLFPGGSGTNNMHKNAKAYNLMIYDFRENNGLK